MNGRCFSAIAQSSGSQPWPRSRSRSRPASSRESTSLKRWSQPAAPNPASSGPVSVSRRKLGPSRRTTATEASKNCQAGTATASGCAGESAEPAAAAEEGGWSFTDDLGNTVELDAVPERVAGLNDVAASLWNYGVEPVATFGQTSAAGDVAFEGRDLADLEIVGESYGQIDLERLAAADPDVIVTSVYPADSSGALDPGQPLYGFESIQQQEQVARIAPIVTIAYRGSAADVMERTVELAGSLGADGAAIDAAREDYEAASAELTAAGERGITVLPVYATASDGWWMGRAADDPSLRLYSDLGVDFVDPGGDTYFWESVSWEQVTDHPSDV